MRAAGAVFEQRACEALQHAGLRLLARNFTTRHGELDLIMREGACVVFVEVRQRQRASHGDALASITASKRQKLVLTAEAWLAANPKYAQHECRFDVVSFDGPAAQMDWLRRAFDAD